MNETRELLERVGERFDFPEDAFEGLRRRRERKQRNKRISGGVVGIAVFVVMVLIATTAGRFGSSFTPASPGPTTTPAPAGFPARNRDYMINLNTGVMTPLPKAILRSLAPPVGPDPRMMYASSPDGSRLAFVGAGVEGSPQIFIAGIDGTGVRQMTHDPGRATSPAWSPDGTSIGYVGYGNHGVPNVFVLDVATGGSTQITDGARVRDSGLQFTPDGSSLLYTATAGPGALMTAPIAGGESTLLFGPVGNLDGAWNGSMSPDGSLVTYLAGGRDSSGVYGGPWRRVANADGTGSRTILSCFGLNPAGAWSPDGGRIVCSMGPGNPTYIVVVDIATGDAERVARGSGAIWLDDHTLLVERSTTEQSSS